MTAQPAVLSYMDTHDYHMTNKIWIKCYKTHQNHIIRVWGLKNHLVFFGLFHFWFNNAQFSIFKINGVLAPGASTHNIFFLIKKFLLTQVRVLRGGSLFGLARLCYLLWRGSVVLVWRGFVVWFGVVRSFWFGAVLLVGLARLCCFVWRGCVVWYVAVRLILFGSVVLFNLVWFGCLVWCGSVVWFGAVVLFCLVRLCCLICHGSFDFVWLGCVVQFGVVRLFGLAWFGCLVWRGCVIWFGAVVLFGLTHFLFTFVFAYCCIFFNADTVACLQVYSIFMGTSHRSNRIFEGLLGSV